MKSIRRSFILVFLAVLTAFMIIACTDASNDADNLYGSSTSDSATPIKVGSKDFTEQFIIGEMYALVLEKEGFQVERRLNLGGTPVAQAGLESGEIDVYPEYTGTGLLTVLKLPASSDRKAVFQTVSKAYKEKYNLVWLDPAPMNNTQALAMTEAGAEKFGVKTISDMVANADQLTMIGPPEFEQREDGLPGIQAKYGDFRLKDYKSVDPGLRYKGLVEGEADVAVAFGTDGEISAFKLLLLEDDKALFPPYQIAPVVRQETLDTHPGMAKALNTLAPKLTDETMQRLNYRVSGEKLEPEEVARDFLTQVGLL